jgi:alpha-glucosidase
MQKTPKKKTETLPAAPAGPIHLPFEEATVSHRVDDVYERIEPDEISQVRWREGAYEFVCRNGITLRIQVLTAGIVRLRYAPQGVFDADFSYAVSPDFIPDKVTVTLEENDLEYLLVSEKLQVVVSKSRLKVKFYDHDDRVLCEDAGGYAAKRSIMHGWNEFKVEKKCLPREIFLGLGDKTCGLNLHGHKYENWCEDSYAFGRSSDRNYRAVPFYYAMHQGLAYGIFLDNSFRTHFDFNSQKNGATTFSTEGGDLNYYFIYGPALPDVSRAYAQLTGTHELPPMWALGYHQCRWSYFPDTKVLQIAARFRSEEIPCDAIYLDIDYMNGFRCFTWNEQYFPDPKGMVDTLRQDGFETVAMIDPGIKEDSEYAVYQEGMAQGHFLKTADGDIAKAPVWPGFCAFPDYTRPETRAWWGELYRDLYTHIGLAGFWNDMNEPAVFHVHHKTLPDHVMHHYDGHPCSHRKAHNIYGQQMSRASWEGLLRLRPQHRPYLLTRATFSGGQRFAAVWTGDNVADWEHLQLANIQCQRLAISGFSFCGTDIGGFAGHPDGELFVRWLQLAVFHPLMRTHSKGDHATGDGPVDPVPPVTETAQNASASEAQQLPLLHPPDSTPVSSREPWAFGSNWTPLARKAIELRYCLLPIVYTAMWHNTLDGTPALRHLLFEEPLEPRFADNERDFMFGEHLMVSPVIQPKVQRQGVLFLDRPALQR